MSDYVCKKNVHEKQEYCQTTKHTWFCCWFLWNLWTKGSLLSAVVPVGPEPLFCCCQRMFWPPSRLWPCWPWRDWCSVCQVGSQKTICWQCLVFLTIEVFRSRTWGCPCSFVVPEATKESRLKGPWRVLCQLKKLLKDSRQKQGKAAGRTAGE